MLADQLSIIVKHQPNAIAIQDPVRGSISYAQLWEYLQTTSAELDARLGDMKYVAGIADQDAHAVIAYTATIMSGRIIVPIDPRHTPSLVKSILKPLTNTIISSNESFSETFDLLPLEEIVTEQFISYSFSTEDADAYILHTSGTTGTPKPVLARQAALLHVAKALADRYSITQQSKVLQFSYLSFDSSLVEIWSTLLSGGTLVIAGTSLREDLYSCLEDLLLADAITVATLPSSIASNLNHTYLEHLTTLILAGDECPTQLANSLYKRIPHLINAYGPTESIICSTTYEITEPQEGRVPIGTPLPGMHIYLNDPDDDGAGEILLASTYLAEGYVNNPDLTDSKFYFNNEQRLYKTGDIGKLNAQGEYEFLGRIDNQIKLHGQRIELEGVEARIRAATKNSNVAVVYRNDKLICIYQADSTQDVFTNLSKSLNGSLPDYAIPGISLPIEAMPLDLNGKINRKELIAYIDTLPHHNTQTSDLEHDVSAMIHLWATVLAVPEQTIQPTTNFFEVGGDSLGALQLVKLINKHYNTTTKLSDIIKSPTTPENMLETIDRITSKGIL